MKKIVSNFRYWLLLAIMFVGLYTAVMALPDEATLLVHALVRFCGLIICAGGLYLADAWNRLGEIPELSHLIEDAMKHE